MWHASDVVTDRNQQKAMMSGDEEAVSNIKQSQNQYLPLPFHFSLRVRDALYILYANLLPHFRSNTYSDRAKNLIQLTICWEEELIKFWPRSVKSFWLCLMKIFKVFKNNFVMIVAHLNNCAENFVWWMQALLFPLCFLLRIFQSTPYIVDKNYLCHV